jgi:sugar phosphate permease
MAFLPMTLVNFGVALQVPRLAQRYGNRRLLVAGLAVCAAGMAWLSRVVPGSAYLTAVALPMVLIGAGQGMVLSPLTAAAIARVPAQDAGAASGVVNVAHQLGNSLGLAVLVALAGGGGLAQRVTTALTASTVFLLLALGLMARAHCGEKVGIEAAQS